MASDPPRGQARAAAPVGAHGRCASVLVIVLVVLSLYLIYLLRRPLTWIFIAGFLAIALSGPVNWLNRRTGRRGLSIAIVYVALILVPVLIAAMLIPPIVEQLNNLIQNLPAYVDDLQEFVAENDRLRELEDGLQHHRRAAEAGGLAARARRRRRGHPLRHRARPRQLDLRRRDDPRPEPVHDRLRPHVARLARRPPGPGPRRVAEEPVRPDRQRRRQLRRRRARAGARRRASSPTSCCGSSASPTPARSPW